MNDDIGGYLDVKPLQQWQSSLPYDWLVPVEYLWEEPLLCSTYNLESARWFLDSMPYREWINSDTRSEPSRHLRDRLTLFCSGPEGVGKTFLASAVIHDLRRRFPSGTASEVGIAYIFCSASFYETQDPFNLLLALLQQLQSHLPVDPEYVLRDSFECPPSLALVAEGLTNIIMTYKRVCLVVDGLNECPPSERESLLRELFKLQVNHDVRFFATSTVEPDIISLFPEETYTTIPCPDSNTMRSYIGEEMDKVQSSFLDIQPKLKETIKDAIVQAMDESFVLAKLQIQTLLTSSCLPSLETALMAMRTGPYLKGFDGVYDVMLQRINNLQPEKSALARLALSYVLCARRPFTVEELYVALTMETSGPPSHSLAMSYITGVLNACSGLLMVVGTVSDRNVSDLLVDQHLKFISNAEKGDLNARVRLVHHTAHAYLQRISQEFILDGEKRMTQLCLRYLSMADFEVGGCESGEELRNRLQTYPLYNYAALHWGHHACAVLLDLHEIESGFFRFFESLGHIQSACQVLFLKSEFIKDQVVWMFSSDLPRWIYWLHLAGHFGILSLLSKRSINEKEFDHTTNPKDSTGTRVLGYAVREGNTEAVNLILKSTNVDIDSRDYQKRTLLILAAMNGHFPVTKLLLSLGADPNLKDEEDCTPLWYAAEKGHTAVVRLLLSSELKTRVDVNVLHNGLNKERQTPLSLAASKGYVDIACLLLAHPDIDPDAGAILWGEIPDPEPHLLLGHPDMTPNTDAYSWRKIRQPKPHLYTPLWLALRNGHCSVATILLDRSDVDFNFAPSRQNENAEVKARPGLRPMFEVTSGSDSDSMESTLPQPQESPIIFDSILYVAVRHGDETFVERILDKIADASVHNLAWGTPLHHAIQMGKEAVVALLLSRLGTSVLGIADSTGYTPEEVAVSLGRVRIMRLLLNAGADPQIRNRNGRTLLAFAANLGEEGMVALLLESEAVDVNSQDNSGRTPLSLALSPCQHELGDVGHRWRQFRKKIRPSTEAGRLGVVRRLLESGRADINYRDDKGRTPLSDAAWNGSIQALNMLLEKAETRLRLDDRDSEGLTALHLATEGGNEYCAMRLLEEGAEPDNLLLSIAAAAGQVAVVGALIAHGGLDLDFRDEHGRTSLCWAAMKGHMAVVEQLLASGSVDVMAQDKDGKTPLHHAATSEARRVLPPNNLNSAVPEKSEVLSSGIVSRLIRTEGVDINARDNMCQTALSLASQKRLLQSVEVLLSSDDIEPNIRDSTGRTPLSLAAQRSVKIVKRLLEDDRVDPDVEDQRGWTPLFWAVYAARWDTIDALLDRAVRKTVNIHHKDRRGRTSLSLALSYSNRSSAARLDVRISSASTLRRAVARSILSGRRSKANFAPAIDRLAEAEYAKLLPQELAPTFLDPNPDWFHSGSGHDRPEAAHYPGWDSARDRFIQLREQNEMDEESQLCARCSELDLDAVFSLIPVWEETVAPSIELIHIMPLTTPQCAMCRLLHQLSTDWKAMQVDDEHQPELSLCASSACKWLVQACHDAGSDLMKWGWFDTVFLKYPQFGTRDCFITRVGSNGPDGAHSVTIHGLGEDADFNQARKWLTACTEHHDSQCRVRVNRSIPHLWLMNCETGNVHRILSNAPVPPFVALSYVWGHQGKDSPEKVVEDAIIATRLLGYQFLWVDRHCVDQNQQTDQSVKSQQILAMDAIYRSAEVTIIAAAGQNSDFGLPGVPGGSRPRSRNLHTRARVKGHVLTVIPPEPIHDVKNSVWWTRAWTFQEGLLSRRRLIFTEREMFFECQGMISREAIELPLQVHRWAARWAPVYEDQRIWSRTHQATSPESELQYLRELIAEFGHRQLTKQSDALNAFLGILQSFSEKAAIRSPIFHLCGIPFLSQPVNGQSVAESFVLGLCWHFDNGAGVRVQRQGFPSWSWTSWEGSVSWLPRHSESTSSSWFPYVEGDAIDITIVQKDAEWELSWLEFEHLAADKMASLPQNCRLRITGNSAKVKISHFVSSDTPSDQDSFHNSFSFDDSSVHKTCYGLNPFWAFICIGDDRIEGYFYPDRFTEQDPDFYERLLKDSWLAIVLAIDSYEGRVTFLVVEQVNDGWERVGLIISIPRMDVNFRNYTRKAFLLH